MTKKKLCTIFKENGLDITADANLKSVIFLDDNFNLETGTYRPYMKPNDTPTYVHKDSMPNFKKKLSNHNFQSSKGRGRNSTQPGL